jgi:integrase
MSRPRKQTPKFSLIKRDETYYVQWWEDDKAKRISTRSKVKHEAERYLKDLIAGRNTPAAPAEPSIRQIYMAYQASRKGQVREHRNLLYAGNVLLPILGEMSPSSLTDERVENYKIVRREQRLKDQLTDRQVRAEKYAKATEKGEFAINGIKIKPPRDIPIKPLSTSTLNRDLTLLRAAMNWAVRNNWMVKAPYIRVPPKAPRRERWLTREEYAWLLECAIEPHVKLFIILGLNTGARKSAIFELCWTRLDESGKERPHVDLKSRRIDFGEGYKDKYRGRHVPITKALFDALTEAKCLATSDYLVEYDGGPIKDIKTGFSAACRRAGLHGVMPHTLRHTAASWMVQKGVTYVDVGRFLGNSAAVVETIYGHHTPDHLLNAAEALG